MQHKFWFGVKVLPRDVVLDVQGRAVTQNLTENGFSQLQQMRIGKYIELSVEGESVEEAQKQVQKMTEFVLYNPLVEKFSIERLEK
ncbi:MAG: phosphoribosylformylglycinamidine synthase subunit PurS [Bdellovibrionia bacterium]